MSCMKCHRALTADEIGLYKKLVNRGALEFLCLECLSQRFACSPALLQRKVDEFRRMGCMLFASDTDLDGLSVAK